MAISSKSCQKTHNFVYSKHLVFKNLEEENLIRENIKASYLLDRASDFGLTYSKYIETGHMPEVEIRFISEDVGYGLYTSRDFEAGEYIGEYTGLISCESSYLKIYNYLFKYPVLNSTNKYFSIDAEPYGNHTRFINHSFKPNLSKHYAYSGGLYHMIFICAKKIAKGNQLTFDYGKNYWYLRGAPVKF